MNRILRILGLALVALLPAGCSKNDPILAPPPSGGSASYAVVAAIGTSLSAGFESGGLVVHHQQKAFTYTFARQAGSPAFAIPSVTADGIPPLLRISGWTPQGQPIIDNTGRTQGTPDNLAWPAPYNNMGVPGALLIDVTNDSRYSDNSTPFPFIARPSLQLGSILDQVAKLNATFVTFEMGANEVLGPGSQGSGTPLMDVATYSGLLHSTLDSLAALLPKAHVAIMTVPDVTSIPYFTTISPRLDPAGNCRVIGPGGPLADNDLVLLPAGPLLAAGTGVPTACGGNNNPLPASDVLPAASVTTLKAAVDGYNAAIRSEATARGYALVDLNGLLKIAATEGFFIQGQLYTSDFVTGGLFGLDGVHPTDLGYAIVCEALIEAVDVRFGSRVPSLNLAEFATATSSRLRPARSQLGLPLIQHPDAVYGALFRWRGIMAGAP